MVTNLNKLLSIESITAANNFHNIKKLEPFSTQAGGLFYSIGDTSGLGTLVKEKHSYNQGCVKLKLHLENSQVREDEIACEEFPRRLETELKYFSTSLYH